MSEKNVFICESGERRAAGQREMPDEKFIRKRTAEIDKLLAAPQGSEQHRRRLYEKQPFQELLRRRHTRTKTLNDFVCGCGVQCDGCHCGVGSTVAATSPRASSAITNRSHSSSVSKQKLASPPPCRSALRRTSCGFVPETHL